MASCHWCTCLREPHEAHSLAKGYLDLVFDISDTRERQQLAERRLQKYQDSLGPLITQNGGFALSFVIEPLGDIVRRRRSICALFGAEYPPAWRRQELRWWREWQKEKQSAKS